MTERPPPDPYDDVNAAVKRDWEDETTPSERVKTVIRHTYDPTSAESVAEQAMTTSKTARKHLERLADDGFVATTPGDRGGTLYCRSGESLITERANRLRSELSTDELTARIAEMRETIRDYRDEYGVDSPEELAVDLGNEAFAGAESDAKVDGSVITEWQTTRRNLAFATAALSIDRAVEHVGGDRSNSTPAVNSP